jgi:hypothetical protein
MTNEELIKELLQFPPDLNVYFSTKSFVADYLYDLSVNRVYLGRAVDIESMSVSRTAICLDAVKYHIEVKE